MDGVRHRIVKTSTGQWFWWMSLLRWSTSQPDAYGWCDTREQALAALNREYTHHMNYTQPAMNYKPLP